MKKIKVFYYCFSGLYLIVWVYFEIYIESESLYWLIAELTGIFLIFFGQIIIGALPKQVNMKNIVAGLGYGVLMIGLLGYRDISNYDRSIWQTKFGTAFNARRLVLGIPEIPAGWHITSRGNTWVDWKAKDSVIGHESKDISFDSIRSIIFENDEYTLKPLQGKKRDMNVFTKYARGKAKDSIFFSYYDGDTSRTISRNKADSLFAAEKIKKDY